MANKDLLFSVDARALRRSLQAASRRLGATEDELFKAINQTIVKYAENTLEEAQERAPVGTGGGGKLKSAAPGALRASGTTDGPHEIGDGIEVFVGFNIEYSRIQDLGGDILPVRGEFLFIPLRAGVRPLKKGDPRRATQKRGVDFALARKVTLPGSQYLTGLMPERAAKATEAIGTKTIELLKKRLGSPPR